MELKDIKTLSGRLKYIRKEMGLSQVDVAKMAKTTQQAIQQAEVGKARNPRYLARLAKQLGIPHEWLALNVIDVQSKETNVLTARENELVSNFRDISKKEQDLMIELIKSRKK